MYLAGILGLFCLQLCCGDRSLLGVISILYQTALNRSHSSYGGATTTKPIKNLELRI